MIYRERDRERERERRVYMFSREEALVRHRINGKQMGTYPHGYLVFLLQAVLGCV